MRSTLVICKQHNYEALNLLLLQLLSMHMYSGPGCAPPTQYEDTLPAAYGSNPSRMAREVYVEANVGCQVKAMVVCTAFGWQQVLPRLICLWRIALQPFDNYLPAGWLSGHEWAG